MERALYDPETGYYPRPQVKKDFYTAPELHPAFAGVLTRELDAVVQQAALGLCFLLFKVLERSLGQPFPVLAEERIQAAYAANVDWLADTEAGARSLLDTLEAGAHPSLVAYVLSVFYGVEGEGSQYDPGVKANLFLLLKTLTEALDIGAIER